MTGIFGDIFARGWDTGLLDDRSWLSAFLEVESALLRAAAVTGAVPETAAADIEKHWGATVLDIATVGSAAGSGGNPVIAIAAALKEAVPQGVRQYVHFGATSQDILDSAAMLLSRRALTVIGAHLTAAADAAAALAQEHLRTEMSGRTLMQDALPTTLGLKAAGWVSGLDGAATRMSAVAASLPVQYGGPVGTFSGSKGHGPQIRRELAATLGLAETQLPWHTVRLPIADLAGVLATAAGIVGKVAWDVVLLAQTAVGEADEGQGDDADGPRRGGSSSMPHKQNPIAAISARACALRTPALAATLFTAMAQEHERAAGAWHSEWETLADLLRLTGSAAAWLTTSLQDLRVYPDRMGRARGDLTGTVGAAVELTEVALRGRSIR